MTYEAADSDQGVTIEEDSSTARQRAFERGFDLVDVGGSDGAAHCSELQTESVCDRVCAAAPGPEVDSYEQHG